MASVFIVIYLKAYQSFPIPHIRHIESCRSAGFVGTLRFPQGIPAGLEIHESPLWSIRLGSLRRKFLGAKINRFFWMGSLGNMAG